MKVNQLFIFVESRPFDSLALLRCTLRQRRRQRNARNKCSESNGMSVFHGYLGLSGYITKPIFQVNSQISGIDELWISVWDVYRIKQRFIHNSPATWPSCRRKFSDRWLAQKTFHHLFSVAHANATGGYPNPDGLACVQWAVDWWRIVLLEIKTEWLSPLVKWMPHIPESDQLRSWKHDSGPRLSSQFGEKFAFLIATVQTTVWVVNMVSPVSVIVRNLSPNRLTIINGYFPWEMLDIKI